MVDLAWKNLLHDRMRFLITVSGVAFAVTLVFVQVGLFLGLLDNASITIDRLDADLWVTSRAVPNVDFAQPFPETYLQRVRSVPGVLRADNLIVAFAPIVLPTGARESVLIYGLEDFGRWGFPWRISEGRLEDLRRGDYFFLDGSATRRFGPFAVGDYREVGGRRLKIIGRTEEARSFTTTPIAFMDLRRAQELLRDQLAGQAHYVVVKLAPGADAAAVREAIRRRLPYNDVFSREAFARHSRSYWIVSTGLGMNMGTTVLLGCLVGIVVVAQTLYTSTMEHLREFGTVKAIGGGNRDIYAIIAKQAAIAAVIGYAVGVGMAFAMRPVMAALDLKLIIGAPLAAAVFAGTVIFCLAAAALSFRKVAAIDPALVFRT